MQERPAQGVPPDSIQDAAPKPLGDTFLTSKRYPGEPTAAAPPPAAPAGPPSGRPLTRIVLPIAIFLAAIGGIAWVTQYLPSRQSPTVPDNKDLADQGRKPAPVLRFAEMMRKADWEPEVHRQAMAAWEKAGKEGAPPRPSSHAAEFEVTTDERQDGGHYDFVFDNPNAEPVALGLESMTCQCTSVTAAVFSTEEWSRYQKFMAKAGPIARARLSPEDGFPWKALTVGETTGLVVPAKAHGAVRVFWVGRNKRDPEKVRLSVKVWNSPPGKPGERQELSLTVTIAYVQPVRFFPERVNVGPVGPQTSTPPVTIYCWSATRDDLEVIVRNNDPCFVYTVTPLKTPEELRKVTADLRGQAIDTLARSACRIDVIVHERKASKQLDLGVYTRTLPAEVKAGGEVLTPTLPVIHGRVQGDVKVGTIEDQGVIDLKVFKKDLGTQAKAELWARPGMELVYESFSPPVLNLKDVHLKKRPVDNVGDWVAWEVRLTVPPGLDPGTLPETSALVLRVQGTPPRRIRIPLTGTASR